MVYGDVPEIAALERMVNPHPWTETMFLEELRLGSLCRVLTKDSGTITAYLVARLLWDEWHLLAVAVAPANRGLGLARTLVQELIVHATQTAARAVMLEVRASNLPAANLYASLGFVPTGVRKNYYAGSYKAEDAIVMERRIARER
ncbi:MAG: rimI [Magnetococcales bacterium]|nr:rimI [Magnetococcales bacterium]